MKMNETNYKQYDTRWGGLGYPKKPWYIKNCGCGEVAICNIIIEMANCQAYTPATIQPYCKQYAEPNGNGTYHSGIPAMMKHYGLTEVKEHATMPALFSEMAKGNRVAILLMGSRPGGSKKIRWTSCGHFIAATGYKKSGSHDMLYIKDSNSSTSARNGWLSYQESIKGDCLKVWSGKLSGSAASTPTAPKDDGKLVVDGIGGVATVRRLQQFLGVTMTDGITIRKDLQKYVPALKAYDYGNGSPTVKAMQKWLGLSGPDGLWGPNTSKALQLKVGFPKAECDGIFGPNSMKKLQTYLNEHDKAVYPVEPTKTNAQKLAEKANTFAWSTNTSKAAYPGGSPTAAYKEGLNKAYPNRSSWGKAPRAGASCDVFVGTCVRCAGIDPNFPRGLSPSYLAKSDKFKLVSVTAKTIQDGDIIITSKHVCIAYGGKVKEASNGDFYPKTTDYLSKRLSASGAKVYRAK